MLVHGWSLGNVLGEDPGRVGYLGLARASLIPNSHSALGVGTSPQPPGAYLSLLNYKVISTFCCLVGAAGPSRSVMCIGTLQPPGAFQVISTFCCLVDAAGPPRSVMCIGTLGVHCRRLICSTFHFVRFVLFGNE